MLNADKHTNLTRRPPFLLCFCLVFAIVSTGESAGKPRVEMSLEVSKVWSGHRVGFSLLTCEDQQYVAYYDQDRQMTVASRSLDSDNWQYRKLDSRVGWDSHNYIVMVADENGYIHLSGNMHCNPLVYFRTQEPHDIQTFKRIPNMVGRREDRCTYPKFLRGPNNTLIFNYRDGGSGNGVRIYNVYDPETQSWRRLLDTPLTDGRGLMNAYPVGPSLGPDGYYHMCWVWRDTPDCSTNHDPSYARSKDLVHWETATGKPISLPMTIDSESLIVDPVPAKGGIINGNTRVGFDSKQRPILSYHKFDDAGNTQLYNARLDNSRWKIYQTSDWDYRWYFEGGGSIGFEIRVSPVVIETDGSLTQAYSHARHGSGIWRLDEATLQPIGKVAKKRRWPAELGKPESDFPGMQVKWQSDSGTSHSPDSRYFLRWETLGANRDRPRQKAPPPSVLRLYTIGYAPR